MFESVEEVDQIEMEPKCEEVKQVPKMPNGSLQNGKDSPDSGHPSSRNFSVTSGLSDGSLSTEDSVAPEATSRSAGAPQVSQSPVQPASDSQVKGKMKGKGEEEEEEEGKAPDDTKTAENIKTGVTGEYMVQPLEEGLVNEPSTTGELGAITTGEMDKTNTPQGVLLVEIKENILDPMAPEAEEKLFSADTGITREAYFASQRDEAEVTTESDESPSAIEMEEIPKAKVSMVPWSRKGRGETLSFSEDLGPSMELRQEAELGKASPEGPESILSEKPEMESLYPNCDSLAKPESIKDKEASQESAGSTFSV